jgi:hypothetical protein
MNSIDRHTARELKKRISEKIRIDDFRVFSLFRVSPIIKNIHGSGISL